MGQVYNIRCLLTSCGLNKDMLTPRRIYQGAPVLLCVFVLAFQSGCAMLELRAPKTEYQTTLGKVAVVAGMQKPEIKFEGFARGKGGGAAKGAWDTFWPCMGAFGSGGCSGDFCGAVVIVELGVCGTAAIVGGVVGAAEAPSDEEMRSAEANTSAVRQITTVQESLRDQIAAAATADGMSLVSVSPQQALDTARTGDYRSLASEGIDTVLETTLTKAGTSGEGVNGPFVQVYMKARVRLIRTDDNKKIFSCDYTYQGEWRKMSEWADNNGQRLLQSFNTGYERLGSHIYDSVFLLYPFPDRWTHSASGFPSSTFFVGLAPVSPATDDTSSSWVTDDELRPTLRWQSFPRETDIAISPEEMGRVKNVRYDLIIASERTEVIYRRNGLPDCVHKVEISLSHDTHYFWTVRARFELDGRQRVTEWGSTSYYVWNQFTVPTYCSYGFKTP